MGCISYIPEHLLCKRNISRRQIVSLVSGIKYQSEGSFLECETERSNDGIDFCGPSGRYYKRKE